MRSKYYAVQTQNEVSAYFLSKHSMLFAFARQIALNAYLKSKQMLNKFYLVQRQNEESASFTSKQILLL